MSSIKRAPCSIIFWQKADAPSPKITLAMIFVVFYGFRFALALLDVPKVRLVERAICRRYYRSSDPLDGNIPEEQCKIPIVQTELARIIGYKLTFDAIPGLLTAPFFGGIADRYGRRPTLLIICLGEVLALASMVAVCSLLVYAL